MYEEATVLKQVATHSKQTIFVINNNKKSI